MTRHLISGVHFVNDRGWGMGRHDGRFGGHPWLGMLCMAILIAAIVALVMWVAGRGRGPVHRHASAPAGPAPVSPTHQAESILAERLARGEISPDDYRASLAALRGDAPGA